MIESSYVVFSVAALVFLIVSLVWKPEREGGGVERPVALVLLPIIACVLAGCLALWSFDGEVSYCLLQTYNSTAVNVTLDTVVTSYDSGVACGFHSFVDSSLAYFWMGVAGLCLVISFLRILELYSLSFGR